MKDCRNARRQRKIMTVSYIEYLESAYRDDPPKQKGQRTRERIKIATAKALERKGYHAMRVTDVTEIAEIAEGSFYIYFKDKTEVTLTVLTDLLNNFFKLEAPRDGGSRSAFQSIQLANRRWIAVCRANAGLMRCILQVGDEAPEFSRLSQAANSTWYRRIAEGVRRRRGEETGNAMLAAYFLGGMMDELVRRLVVYPDPELHELLTGLGMDDDAVADAVSLIWLRVLHPDQAPRGALPEAVTRFADWLAPAAIGRNPS